MDKSAEGGGWVLFAGLMMALAATLNCIWGIAAIDNANFFVEHERFVFENLNAMGWFVLVVGIVQLVAAFSIWAGGEFGRVIGIMAACLGAFTAVLSLAGFPLWSVCVFFVNVLIVYGLATYGGRQSRSTHRAEATPDLQPRRDHAHVS